MSTLRQSRQRGFTLIEVMAAVVILAMAMAAIIAGFAHQANLSSELRDRSLATIVAHNRLTEITLAEEFPEVGRSDGDIEFADIEWTWRVAVIETEDPELRRVDIAIERTEDGRELASLTGFLSSTSRQQPL